jgi:hypothetical protein
VSIEVLATAVFGLSPYVRYVALRTGDELSLQERSGIYDASSSNSDRYEELLVNPTLLLLTTARGQIDCGGLEYLLIRYCKFFALIHPVRGGHITIGISVAAEPLALVDPIRDLLRANALLPIV